MRRFRLDAGAVLLTFGLSFSAYGHQAWMLALALLARAVQVSLADNAYHYRTRLEAPLEAMNLALPPALERFLLAFNLHSVHHRHPGLRWHELRAAFLAEGDRLHLGWFAAVARQLRGPVPVDSLDSAQPATARRASRSAVGQRTS